MRLCSRGCISLTLVLFVGAFGLKAQSTSSANAIQPQSLAATPAADSRVVFLPVLVVDESGRAVTSLTRENLSVAEDGRPQVIRSFTHDDPPYSIGILLDLSGSMARRLPLERAAVLQFLRFSNPQDEFFLMGFSDHPELLVNFTSSRETIAAGFDHLHVGFQTALYDAISSGLNKMKEARYPRRALLLISDGGDNASHLSDSEIHHALRQSSVQVETVGIFDFRAVTLGERDGPDNLSRISSNSGGRLLPVEEPAQAGPAGAALSAALRLSYLLSYTSDNPTAAGEWRKVKVKLSPPKGMSHLTVHARAGYYAPSR